VDSDVGSPLDELLEDLEFLTDPMERLRAIIDLGEDLAPFPESSRIPQNTVRGCTSQVWISHHVEVLGTQSEGQRRLIFLADADAQIVRGLAALLTKIYSNKSPSEILDIDVEAIFERIDLTRQLTPGRQNGLLAMVNRIRAAATVALEDA
jgi:cysteine desulfuration protein SufE